MKVKVVTAAEMQNIDRITIEEKGIPSEVLMCLAGKSVADYIISVIKPEGKIAVFCGTGNNGGDGFVAGYYLFNKGFNPEIFIAGNIEKISAASDIYFNVCLRNNIKITQLSETALAEIDLSKYSLIVDALLGTGFSGIPKGIIKNCINKIIISKNENNSILSVDLPSGLSSNGEAPAGEVVKADYTVTIGLPKISLVTYPGAGYAGRVYVSDIGFPAGLCNSPELHVDLIDRNFAGTVLNMERDPDSHKGSAGHLLLIGGFDNMEGAIMMSAMSAFETGAGLATLMTTPGAREIIAGKIPELITNAIDLQNGKNDKNNIYQSVKSFFSNERRYRAMIIGPGMGRSDAASLIFSTVLDNISEAGIKKVLIDGDGLYHLHNYLKRSTLPGDVSFILSPHFGEASLLLGRQVDEIKNNRLKSAVELAGITSAVVLLKGPASIISNGKDSGINTTGNPSLGTAGAGDVLSGIIGALLLRDIPSLDTAGTAAYIHGLAADICIGENKVSLKATDIIKFIRPAINRTLSYKI